MASKSCLEEVNLLVGFVFSGNGFHQFEIVQRSVFNLWRKRVLICSCLPLLKLCCFMLVFYMQLNRSKAACSSF